MKLMFYCGSFFQSIQDLPWECMPILKGMPVSRMPSLSLLCAKLSMMESESVLERGFDSSKTYYVLNPAGDLTHSQQYFQEKFKKYVLTVHVLEFILPLLCQTIECSINSFKRPYKTTCVFTINAMRKTYCFFPLLFFFMLMHDTSTYWF